MTRDEHRALTTVHFPLAGPGAVIRFRTADLVHLAKTFASTDELWFQGVCRRVRTPDPKAIVDALAVGLKNGETDGPLDQLDWSDLPFPIEAAAEPLLSAVGRALYGRRYIEAAQLGSETAPTAGGARCASHPATG